MRTSLFLIVLLVCSFLPDNVFSAPVISPEDAARGVINRLLPGKSRFFGLEIIPPDKGRDVFEVEAMSGKIILRGTNGVSICSALNWYLEYYCNASISWSGSQLSLPDPLPVPKKKIRRWSPHRFRYIFNYCTFSYTLAWWNWPQWERMIDCMALHGINMPLAIVGQEAVWQQVYRDLGLSDKDIKEFFVGPAYLPFGWMGCMDGWGGPLPQSWIDRRLDLQKKILARERSLGMKPVLQGFTGHVPFKLKDKFPATNFKRLPSWCGFPGTYFVDPMDSLFTRIGKKFIETQTRLFGTDHLYASDTFIEMSPPSNAPEFLARMGEAVYGAMKAADRDATWVMQGWIFVNNPNFWKPPQAKALFSRVPDDRMIVIDLACEWRPAWPLTEAFYGKPWLWCIIQNYGHVINLHGGLHQVTKNLAFALESPAHGKLSGIGMIMEGLGPNPIVYDWVTDMTWRTSVPDLDAWVNMYVTRRYGQHNMKAEKGWKLLLDTVYHSPGQTRSVVCTRPGLRINSHVSYSMIKLFSAWSVLLDAAPVLGDLDTYRFDVVNIGRQVLANMSGDFYGEMMGAYRAKNKHALAEKGERFLGLIKDMDKLVGTRREFLLGKWLEDAKSWATNNRERRLYEWNARNQITLWGPKNSGLHGYARKQWAGLLQDFYLERWKKFLEGLKTSLVQEKDFNSSNFEAEIRAWEERWTHTYKTYTTEPEGESVTIAGKLCAKYKSFITEPEAKSLTTGKPVSCSMALPGFPARLANDGRRRNTGSYWATDITKDKEAWWQVDLEKPLTIGRVVVVLYYGDTRYYGFTVSGSTDGRKWRILSDQRDNKKLSMMDGITCTFDPAKVRYLRVNVMSNSANTGRHLVEVMAFEK